MKCREHFWLLFAAPEFFFQHQFLQQTNQFYSPCNNWKMNNLMGHFIMVVIFQKGFISFCCPEFCLLFPALFLHLYSTAQFLLLFSHTTKAEESSLCSKVPLLLCLEISAFLGIFLMWETLSEPGKVLRRHHCSAPLGFQALCLDSLKSLILDSLTNLHQKGLLMLIRALRGNFCHLVLVVVWSLFCCWF